MSITDVSIIQSRYNCVKYGFPNNNTAYFPFIWIINNPYKYIAKIS